MVVGGTMTGAVTEIAGAGIVMAGVVIVGGTIGTGAGGV